MRSGHKWNTAVSLVPITQTLISYAQFGMKDGSFENVNWDKPSPKILGLLRQRVPEYPALRIDPSTVQTGYIAKVCKRQDRFLKYLLWEWARMNPDQIILFVQCLQQEKNFRTYYYGAYEGIQMIYERITSKSFLRVD